MYKFDGVAEHAVLTCPHGNVKINLMQYLRKLEASYLKVLASCPLALAYNLRKLQQERLVLSVGNKAPISSGYGTRDMVYVTRYGKTDHSCYNTIVR